MMKQARSWLALAVVVTAHLAGCPTLQALDPTKRIGQFPRTRWDRVDGLPFSGITALTVTSDGYLWIGTQEGLARFDGARFVVFDKSSVAAFEDHFITSLAPGEAGELWIGTRRGLLRYRQGGFERFGADHGLPYEYVRTLLRDRVGRLWIGTYGGGLALWRDGVDHGSGAADGGGVERVWGEADGLLHPIVRALCEDPSGVLWIGTSGGLHRLDPEAPGSPLTAFTTADGLPSDFIRALAMDEDGSLWVGTEGGGLARRRRDGRFTAAETPVVRTVGALLVDRDGQLWVGSDGEGLWRRQEDRVEAWTATGAAGDLPHDAVWSLLEDPEGSVWIGTRGGLVHLWDGDVTSITSEQGLTSDDVRTVYQEPDGMLWIGGQGLDRWLDGEILPPPPSLSLSLAAGPGRDEVRTVLRTSEGSLWLGTPRNLKRLDESGVRVYSAAEGLAAGSVNALAEDPSGALWVGTAGGLSRFEGDDEARETLFSSWTSAQGLPDDSVRALLPDPSGGLWVGTEAGLAHWRAGEIETLGRLGKVFVLSLYLDADGVLWVGTSGDGLLRWQGSAAVGSLAGVSSRHGDSTASDSTGVTRYRMRDGLFNDLIFQILEDDRGGLWMSCSKGLFRVDRDELERFARGETERVTSLWLDESDGMASAESNGGTQPAGWRARDGRLWFATARGVAVVDPADPLAPRAPPPLVIEEVRVDGEVREPRSPVRVGPGGSSVEIHYTAPSFVAPSKLRFRYRLEGFHEADRWEDAGARRAAYFTGLPPGDYRFEVTAAHGQGAWQPSGALLELELVPFFYQTPTFLALVAALLLLGGVVAFRLRIRALRVRQQELERLVDRRTHELAEANQTLARLAVEDDLTGVPNHRKLQSALQDEWRRGVRSREALALLMIDIDHFKRYNDTYGHQQGDRCLRQVAQALAGCVHRPGDLVARYGGEEFAAVLPRTDRDAAHRLAEDMRRAVETLNLEHAGVPDDAGAAGRVTLSVGVTSAVPSRELPPDLFLTTADEALYEAKTEGRNRVVFLAP